MNLEVMQDFTEEQIKFLSTLPVEELEAIKQRCEYAHALCNTNQHNRKILINGLYGALGNIHFRFYDLRNASATTSFGQLAIQWIARKVNEYLNGLCGTEDHEYVVYCDTDSIYVELTPLIEDKIGVDKFKDTNSLVDFMDKFGSTKMEPVIDAGFRELCEYMNNREHLMFMDREAIACPPVGSKGVGGFWTAKKRYGLNVYDMEGVRFTTPHLKIMGLETQRSSTPEAIQKALYESIRIILQEGEESLQGYYKKFESEYKKLDHRAIATVSSANNLGKYDDGKGYPGPKCPYHVRGALAYNRAIKGFRDVDELKEGDKVMVLPLKPGNPFGEKCIAWSSGDDIPIEIRNDVIAYIDHATLFAKTFVGPLETVSQAAGLDYEKRSTLDFLFG